MSPCGSTYDIRVIVRTAAAEKGLASAAAKSGASSQRKHKAYCTAYARSKSLECLFFFFQAEDGIRDVAVTGVQTCALPISCFTALCVVAIARPALPLAAQQGGPLPAPPAGTITASGPATQSSTGPREPTSHIINEPPAMPVDEIIQKFAQREEDFRKERDNFTYTQDVGFQTIDEDGQVDGEFREVRDILFTPGGKRYDKVTYAPVTTITRLKRMSRTSRNSPSTWPSSSMV